DPALLEPALQRGAGVHRAGGQASPRGRNGAGVQGDSGRQARCRAGGRVLHEGRDRGAALTMADTLKLEIVTPAGTGDSENVEMVTLPGVVGEMGVYPQHVPLIAHMVPGEMIVRKDGRDVFMATGEGLIEVTAKRVAVLTDLAIPADRIDEAKAEEARQRAEARLHDKLSAAEVATVNASLARSLAQLRVKRRRQA